ncbi:MAG TPA: TRAP transporter small permease [Desulfurivibrionaceae bacterium]|nr:TRAP transporter small permease [Desulfurivibrionaceae bacterium]
MTNPTSITPRAILTKITGFFHHLEEGVAVGMLLTMIVLTCLQVGMRTFFSSGIDWADSLLRYLVLWSGLLGAAICTRQGQHINIDLASRLLPVKWLRWLGVVLNIFSTLVCAGLSWSGYLFVKSELEFGGNAALLGLAHWQLSLAFPLVFALITLRFLIISGQSILGRATIKPVVPDQA